MSGGYLPHTPHYKVFAIKAASDIVTSIIMKISDHYDLLAIILVSSIDLYNISPIKLILRVEVIVTRWIRNSETCQCKIDKTLKTNLNTNVAKLLEAKHAVVSRVSRVRC